MRVTEYINVQNIIIDNYDKLPLNPTTLALIDAMRKKELDLPPIKVDFIDGNFLLKDGRHRYVAHKLLGKKKIKAKYFKK